MTTDELIAYRKAILVRRRATLEMVEEVDPAPSDRESLDKPGDVLMEGIFLRAFTAYEESVEKLFLHYVTGGVSSAGSVATSYLNVRDEGLARKVTLAGKRFLHWGNPGVIRATADTYIKNGWPISEMMNARSGDLIDCQRVRNCIAHSSLQALEGFRAVQRSVLHTERIFSITPGQLLRIRKPRSTTLYIAHLLDVMYDTLDAIIDPPEVGSIGV